MITEKQVEFKKGRMGASDAASALGVNPFETPAGFVLRTLNMIEPEPFDDFGSEVEEAIARGYGKKTGTRLHLFEETIIHKSYPWLIAHPDRIASDRLVEIKSVGPNMGWTWGPDGDAEGVPDYVMIQCAVQSMLADVDKVDVAAYFGGNDLRIYPLTISNKNKDDLLHAVVDFWQTYVEQKQIPPLGHKDLDSLKRLFPHDNEEVITGDEEMEKMIWLYGNAVMATDKAEKEQDQLKAQIQMVMGKAGFLKRASDDKNAFSWVKSKDSRGTKWETAFNLLKDLIPRGITEEEINNIIKASEGVTKKGSRKFLFKLKKEFKS